MPRIRRLIFAILTCGTLLDISACKAKKQDQDQQQRSEPSVNYGPPVGAKVTGNAKVASFDLALAAQGATPDACLPMAIQAITNMSTSCPALPLTLRQEGHIAITFEAKSGQLDASSVRSDSFDDEGLACVRAELKKAMSQLPAQQDVKYLLQVRPLAS